MLRAYGLVLLCLLFGYSLDAQRKYVLEKLNSGVNTAFDEIAPLVSLDGKTLYFTRLGSPDFERTLIEFDEDLAQTLSAQEYEKHLGKIYTTLAGRTVFDPFSSAFNQDVWIATSEGSEFNTLNHPGYPLNNALPNSISSLTPAGNEVIVINQFVEEGGMSKGFSLVRHNADDSWSFPEPITINNYHNSGPDVSMCISSDGSVMILSLERYDSRGKSDLYVSFREGSGWSAPQNIRSINTGMREATPFLSEDKEYLFFASDRRGRNWGSDIYMVRRKDDSWQNWSRPMRYQKPINSKADDSRPYFNAETGYLYFTSKRDGNSDIFRVQIAGPNPMFVTVTGKIINSETGELMPAEIHTGFVNSEVRNIYVSTDGNFSIKVPKGGEFSLQAHKPGFEGPIATVNYKKKYAYFKEKRVDLELKVAPTQAQPEPKLDLLTTSESAPGADQEIAVGKKIELDPIFFAQSKAVILKKSYPSIDKLADYLKENSFINIRITGHTDNLGNPNVLQRLSDDRAKAVKDYLVYQRHINPLRIEALGMGSSQPVNDNSTETLRGQNRRVEVEISEITKLLPLGMQEEEKK